MYFLYYIVKRYLVAKSRQNIVNIINMVTFFVVVIGGASLFIVLSGFSGLKTFSISFSNTFDPDLKALSAEGKYFHLNPDEASQLQSIKGIVAYAREVEERVFLTHKQKNHVAYLKGIGKPYTTVTNIDSTLYLGNWDIALPNQAIIGLGTAALLGIGVTPYGAPLQIIAPKPGKGSLTNTSKPYNELFVNVTGIYAINEELDKKYVFVALATVQELLNKRPTEITGINFKLDKSADQDQVIRAIKAVLKDKVILKSRTQLNDVLYKMLNTENLVIYLIFTLVLIIALFNVVGAIFIMILDKRATLKTLYALGVPIPQLKKIFFFQGLSITTIGGITGIILGTLLVWTQQAFGWLKITPSLPYPIAFKTFNIATVLMTILILGTIASGIASSRISKKHLR